ncbi:MAG: thioredoxin [Clostridiales bacterium]|nr:thioredoxin [Clostridiales bacterium]
MVKVIENNNFDEIKNSDFAVVDFSATWCGPCRMVAPVVEELSDELDGSVDFFNVDVDENGELAARFQIASIPAIAVFKKGECVDMSVGLKPKEDLKTFILNQKD